MNQDKRITIADLKRELSHHGDDIPISEIEPKLKMFLYVDQLVKNNYVEKFNVFDHIGAWEGVFIGIVITVFVLELFGYINLIRQLPYIFS